MDDSEEKNEGCDMTHEYLAALCSSMRNSGENFKWDSEGKFQETQ